MSKLTIVANIHAHPDRIDLVKAELEKLVPITRAKRVACSTTCTATTATRPISCFMKTGSRANCGKPTWLRPTSPPTCRPPKALLWNSC